MINFNLGEDDDTQPIAFFQTTQEKEEPQAPALFAADSDDEEDSITIEELRQKGAKLSKNYGQKTRYASHHPLPYKQKRWTPVLPRPSHNTEPVLAEETRQLSERELREQRLAQKKEELQELRNILEAEKKRIKVCRLCQRKFAGADHLKRHEQQSALHKERAKGVREESQN